LRCRQRNFQVGERQRLNLAFACNLKFIADLAGEIDVEAGKLAVLIRKIERRKIDRRQEAQAHERRKIRLCQALPGIEEQWQTRRSLLGQRRERAKKYKQRQPKAA
jgi:hypothetical protein